MNTKKDGNVWLTDMFSISDCFARKTAYAWINEQFDIALWAHHEPVLHCDLDSVFCSTVVARMRMAGVILCTCTFPKVNRQTDKQWYTKTAYLAAFICWCCCVWSVSICLSVAWKMCLPWKLKLCACIVLSYRNQRSVWFKQNFIQDKIKIQRIVMCSSTSCSL